MVYLESLGEGKLFLNKRSVSACNLSSIPIPKWFRVSMALTALVNKMMKMMMRFYYIIVDYVNIFLFYCSFFFLHFSISSVEHFVTAVSKSALK